MNFTLEQLKQTKVGQMPSNTKQLTEIKPGKFYEHAVLPRQALPSACDHPMHLEPQQIGSEDGLNKTERAYLGWLRTLSDSRIWVQSIGLRLSKKCYYYPDFAAFDPNGFRFIDTKGSWDKGLTPHVTDDSLIKIKWAAQIYSPCRFLIAWKAEDGTWKHKEICP